MKKKTAALLSSCAAIAVCSSLIVGSTYALFTSKDTVNIAVTAGQVKLTAWVDTDNVKSESTLGGEAIGTFKEVEDGYAIENIFPGDEFTFTVQAKNESTVSTLYRTNIKIADTELASALVVTIAGVEYEGLVNYTSAWAELAVNESPEDFEVKVAFPNGEDQDDLQNKGTTISVSVEGVQANAGYEDDGEPTVVISDRVYLAALDLNKTGNSYVVKGFAEDAELTELVIPAQAEGLPITIAEAAFKNNTTIEEVTIKCAEVPEYAFQGCVNLKKVVLEEGVEVLGYHSFGCKEIGYGAYDLENGNKLEEVYIPASVETIIDAFVGCTNLKKVTFAADSKLTTIGSDAFRYCALEEITIPATVTKIGDFAFAECNLKEVVIPAGVKTIEYGAFQGCKELVKVTIPASVTTLGSDIFSGCDNLSEIYYGGTVAEFNSLIGSDNVIEYLVNYGATNEITIICSDSQI